MKDNLLMMVCSMFKELGIKTMGEMFAILKLVKETPISPLLLANNAKTQAAKLSQLHLRVTTQQFGKFKINWYVLTKMTTFFLTVKH